MISVKMKEYKNLNNVPVSYAGGSWSDPIIQINNNYFFDPNDSWTGLTLFNLWLKLVKTAFW